jgi:hypothetical protein
MSLATLASQTPVISTLDNRVSDDRFAPLGWSPQDATNLTLEDASFDFAS